MAMAIQLLVPSTERRLCILSFNATFVHGNWMNPCHIFVPRFTLEGVIFMYACPHERVSYLCTPVHMRGCHIYVPWSTLDGVIFLYPGSH
jgi:hypothetical protein